MRRQLRRSFRHIEGERDRLRMLLERLHEGVVTVDHELVVQFANAEARRVLGVRLAEGDQLPEPWDGFSLRGFAEAAVRVRRAARAGACARRRRARARASSASRRSPRATRCCIVLDDLTEQERRELAEREFVTNAAHELRTPLTTIIGAVEVLQAGAKNDPVERDRFLAHIEREAERLARLARALLTLARAHAGQERPRVETVVAARAPAPTSRPTCGPPTACRSRSSARRSSSPSVEPRPARAGAAEPRRERGEAHARRADRVARVRGGTAPSAWRSRTPASG